MGVASVAELDDVVESCAVLGDGVADELLDVLGRADWNANDARAGGVVASRTDVDAFGGVDDVNYSFRLSINLST